jgi:hypothetical protein
MPRARRPDRQRVGAPVTDNIWLWLVDEFDGAGDFDILLLRGGAEERNSELRQIAEQAMPAILAYFVPRHWGKRPAIWWQFGAPQIDLLANVFPLMENRPWHGEPRQRVGGKGFTPWDCGLGIVPCFEYGLPTLWEKDDFQWRRDGRTPPAGFVALDPDDAPLFESEASYLKRHDLFLPGEERRLGPADFEPEAIDVGAAKGLVVIKDPGKMPKWVDR